MWCRTATTSWDRIPAHQAQPTTRLPGSSPSQKGVQGESNSRPLRPERRIMPLDHAPTCLCKKITLLDPGIEPGTYCVLGSRHNQLDQPSKKASSEGLEPSISRFVVSRLIQLGHEDFSTLPLPVPPRDSIPLARPFARPLRPPAKGVPRPGFEPGPPR